MLFAVAATVVKSAVVAGVALTSVHAYTVVPGDTLSGIAASHGESLSQIEGANPQFSADWNLIMVGQQVNLGGSGVVEPSFTPSPSAPSPSAVYTPPVTHYSAPAYTPPAPAVSSGDSSGSLSDVPGVPTAFAACVAERESSDGTNAAYNGGDYGIITASGINVNGQSLSAQKAAFSKLYAEDGTAPWAPSDGC
jgi:LysM repeat protein